MSYFEGKTILITGASSGIGKDLALTLAKVPHTKLILLGREASNLTEVGEICKKHGSEIMTFVLDVTDEKGMTEMSQTVLSKWAFVDIIIANAGIGGTNPAANFSNEINRKVFEVNVFGFLNTILPFIPRMKEKGKGQIIGVSSLASFRGLPAASSYSASKSAQAKLLESFRVDLKPYGIHVGSIFPGFIKTPMTDHDEFKMPFTLTVGKSTKIILRAIKKRKSKLLYPWQMMLLTKLNLLLPNWLYDFLIPRLSGQKQVAPQLFGNKPDK